MLIKWHCWHCRLSSGLAEHILHSVTPIWWLFFRHVLWQIFLSKYSKCVWPENNVTSSRAIRCDTRATSYQQRCWLQFWKLLKKPIWNNTHHSKIMCWSSPQKKKKNTVSNPFTGTVQGWLSFDWLQTLLTSWGLIFWQVFQAPPVFSCYWLGCWPVKW